MKIVVITWMLFIYHNVTEIEAEFVIDSLPEFVHARCFNVGWSPEKCGRTHFLRGVHQSTIMDFVPVHQSTFIDFVSESCRTPKVGK